MSCNLLLQYLLPKHALSRLIAKLANCRINIIKNFIIRNYCKFYQIDMSEALESDCLNYSTFNDFFTRALRPDARPVTLDPHKIISPVDGKIWQFGTIADQLINAKGRGFSVEQLLASEKDAAMFHGGVFNVLYLAPDNYHRVHMPLKGRLRSMRYVPGKLFSVNPRVVNDMPDLFAKNERVVAIFDTALGQMAVVFVGAMIVGSIETKWEGVVTPNKKKSIIDWDYNDQEIVFEQGIEIGRFKLGSTVILLFPANSVKWDQALKPDLPIKMGQDLGKLLDA